MQTLATTKVTATTILLGLLELLLPTQSFKT